MNDKRRLHRFSIWKSIAFVAIVLQAIPACAAMVVAGVSFFCIGDRTAAWQFALFSVIVGGVAFVCWRWMKRPYVNVLAVNSAAVAVAWIVASLCCAIPIATVCRFSTIPNETTKHLAEPINAWYESMSSISSSGLSVAAKSSEVPKPIQLWRSLNQWIGGVGLAVFALLILGSAEQGSSMYAAETRSWRPGQSVRAAVSRLLAVYFVITIACVTLFAVAGMPAWDTLNHSLIIVSTGGLTVTDDSFGGYSPTIQFIGATFMLLGALSFGQIYLGGTGRWKQLVQQSDLRAIIFWMLGLSAVFLVQASLNADESGRDSVFNLISAISTCGVSSGKLSEFAVTSIWLLIVAMFIGGCSDSTAGGIKLNRAFWMLKCFILQLNINLSLVDPSKRPTWNGKELDRDEADQRTGRVLVILFVFAVSLALGFLALRICYDKDITSDRVLFQATSAIGAVGLSMELSGPDRPTLAKVVEIVLMIAGRLEVMALFLMVPVALGFVNRDATPDETTDRATNEEIPGQ